MPKFIKITKITHPINWWNQQGVLGETFEVLDMSKYGFVKICYCEGTRYGWVPLDVCEVNPHLRLVT